MSEAMLLLCTVADRREAERLAEALVEERLAACVQATPIESWYRWQGRIERATEQRLHIKIRAAEMEAAIARIRALHSYAVPEIVAVPIVGGAPDYLGWIAAETA